MSHRDGHIYDGKFKNWRKHGEGKMTYRNGDIYTGVWDGHKGTGTIAYTDGSSYEGEFLKDRKDGEGTYKLPSGNTYTGTYKVVRDAFKNVLADFFLNGIGGYTPPPP